MIAVLDAFVYPGSELWLYNEASYFLHLRTVTEIVAYRESTGMVRSSVQGAD